MLENLDLDSLFDTESKYGKEHIMGELTDDMISRAEENIGYKLPESYKELLRFQNGGLIDDDESWLTAIYGIGAEADAMNGLEDMFVNWMEEWEYPNIGIPFGETQTAGHDMYFMDYRNIDANGEPEIVLVENEGGPEDVAIKHIADNFRQFLQMVIDGENIEGEE